MTIPAPGSDWKPNHDVLLPPGMAPLSAPYAPEDAYISGPAADASFPNWLQKQTDWRAKKLQDLHFDSSFYNRPDQAWTQHIWTQDQLMVWDRSFYDPSTRAYTVDRFLDSVEKRCGHLDAVLIWGPYPNMGVDDRNQLDLLYDLPGGLPALQEVVAQFHTHGTRVYFPYLVWANGTRPAKEPIQEAFAKALKQIGADGITFDTLDTLPPDFAAIGAKDSSPLNLELPFTPRDSALERCTLSWSDWIAWDKISYPKIPMVSRAKWLEPRHQVLVTDRYARVKVDSIQHAFFNGEGYALLENLWGFWDGMTPWDAEAVLRCTTIERAVGTTLMGRGWEPHSPTLQAGIYASRFPQSGQTLWTLVNRNEYAVEGEQLKVADQAGARYYDLWHGCEIHPRVVGNMARLSFSVDPLGFGAILMMTAGNVNPAIEGLVKQMGQRAVKPLVAYSREWNFPVQTVVNIPQTKRISKAPPGMILIPESNYDFAVKGIEIESGNDPGVDVQYPWETTPRRFHRHNLRVNSFYIDRTPVTQSDFRAFIVATRYHPLDSNNFLRDWTGDSYPGGCENHPVTWVSIEDARAYATWAGKRLPHEWEWQCAAQDGDGRIYPWGSEWDAARVPAQDHGPTMRAPSDVGAFPNGANARGIVDLVGNISQWTDEFEDEHTRSAIVRGGTYYQPPGSIWYFPRTYRLDEHEKYLLMSPGRDRSATIGFRCVVDAK